MLGLTSTEVAIFLSNQNFLKSRGQKDMLQMLQICSARSPQIRLLTKAQFPIYTKKCVSLETSEQSFKRIFGKKKKRSHVVVNIKAHKI